MNDQARLATPDGIELDFPLAGFASRALAAVVDLLVLCVFWALLLLAGLGVSWVSVLDGGDSFAMALAVLAIFLSYWGYGIFWELTMRGQTPGKRLLGLRVIRENGLPVNARQSILRNLLRAVDLQPGASYAVAIVAMLSDEKGRRLGDLVAGTIVVRDSIADFRTSKAGALWAARAEEGKSQQAVKLPGGSLSASQLSVVEQFLERRQALDPARRAEVAQRIAGALRGIVGGELLKLLDRDPERLLEQVQSLANAAQTQPEIKATVRRRGSLF